MRRNPFDDIFDYFFRDFSRLFREFDRFDRLDRFERDEFSKYREPYYDLWEDDENIYISIELPGVDKNDIDLRIDENEIDIKVESSKESKEEKENYRGFKKVSYHFYKRIALPTEINPDKAKATYKNGVLEIVAPKAKPDKGKKRVNIE